MTTGKKNMRAGLASVFGGLETKTINKGAGEAPDAQGSRATGIALVKDTGAPSEAATQNQTTDDVVASASPYSHMRRVKWPILPSGQPYITPAPEEFSNLNAAINCRIPADLNATLDIHCRMVGAKKSEWVREALIKYLADEQATLGESS